MWFVARENGGQAMGVVDKQIELNYLESSGAMKSPLPRRRWRSTRSERMSLRALKRPFAHS